MTKMIDRLRNQFTHTRTFLLAGGVFLLLLLMFRPVSPEQPAKEQPDGQPVAPLPVADTLSLQVFNSEKGWGYDLYVNHRRFIHQPTIPAVAGNRGFRTREQAEKVGQIAVQKMRQLHRFPSFTLQELDSLEVLTP